MKPFNKCSIFEVLIKRLPTQLGCYNELWALLMVIRIFWTYIYIQPKLCMPVILHVRLLHCVSLYYVCMYRWVHYLYWNNDFERNCFNGMFIYKSWLKIDMAAGIGTIQKAYQYQRIWFVSDRTRRADFFAV